MGSWKTAWKAARKLAGAIPKGDPDDASAKPLACRIHDLRYTAISRMINAGIPLPKAAKIVGWSPSTMVKMAARYGHFTTDDLREAMETISTGSPVYSPVHTDKVGAKVQ
jgi:integrase